MRVLVTGAAGFVGSTLADRLIADGHDVVGVDDLSTGKLANLADARAANKWRRGAFSFLRVSLTDPSLAEHVAHERPDVVCHLAATGDIAGTVCVVRAAAAAGAGKVVYTSGAAMYGTPAQLPVSERVRPAPESPDGAGQAAGELYLHAYRATTGLDWTSLALADVYGPRGGDGAVAAFGAALLRGEPTSVCGAAGDYVYVDDVVDAYVRALDRGSGRRFNIGTGIATTDRALHTLVATATGAPDKPEYVPPTGVARAIALDPTAARGGLGWEPWTSLDEGVRATVEWLRA